MAACNVMTVDVNGKDEVIEAEKIIEKKGELFVVYKRKATKGDMPLPLKDGSKAVAKGKAHLLNKDSGGIVHGGLEQVKGPGNLTSYLYDEVSVSNIKETMTNIRYGQGENQTLSMYFGNFATLINSGVTTAQKLAATLIDGPAGAIGSTVESSVHAYMGLRIEPVAASAHDVLKAYQESLGSVSKAEADDAASLFKIVTNHILRGDERAAYIDAGHAKYVKGSGPDPLQMHRKAAAIFAEGYKNIAKDFGLPPDPNYSPLKWSASNAHGIFMSVSGKNVYDGQKIIGAKLFGPALAKESSVPLTAKQQETLGISFVRQMHKNASFTSHADTTGKATGKEIEAIMRDMVASGLSEKDAMQVAQGIISKADPDTPSHLMHRIKMDRNFSAEFKLPNGKTQVIRVNDLYKRDAFGLFDEYGQTMSGHMGAKKFGMEDNTVWEHHIANVQNEAMQKGMTPAATDDLVKRLNFMRHMVMRKPLAINDDTVVARSVAGLKSVTRIATLGALPISTAVEHGAMSAYHGIGGFFHKTGMLGFFSNYINRIKGAPPMDAQSAAFRHMGYIGELVDWEFHDPLSADVDAGVKYERGLKKVVNAHSTIFGIDATLNNQKRAAANATLAVFNKVWKGELTDPSVLDHIARSGVNTETFPQMMRSVDKYVKFDDSGDVRSIDVKRWIDEEPQTYFDYLEASKRRIEYMTSERGKADFNPLLVDSHMASLFMQFKEWMQNVFNNMVSEGISRGDAVAMTRLLHMMIIGSVTTVAMNQIRYADDPQRLEEEQQYDRILAAAFAKTGVAFLLPSMYNAFAEFTGYAKPNNFSNSGNNNLPLPAAANTLVKLIDVMKAVSDISARQEVTKQSAKKLTNVLPSSPITPLVRKQIYELFPESRKTTIKPWFATDQ